MLRWLFYSLDSIGEATLRQKVRNKEKNKLDTHKDILITIIS